MVNPENKLDRIVIALKRSSHSLSGRLFLSKFLEESPDGPYYDACASDNCHPKSESCDDDKGCASIVGAGYGGLASSVDVTRDEP